MCVCLQTFGTIILSNQNSTGIVPWKSLTERCSNLPDSAFRLLFQHRKPIWAAPAPRSYIYRHIRGSRKCTIYQMSHHSNALSVRVCVQPEPQRCGFVFTTLCASLSDVSRKVLFFFFLLCQCPLHACPNLATCYGWLIIFDGGLPSEWGGSTLDWKVHLYPCDCRLLLISVCCLYPHFSISSSLAELGLLTGWETSAEWEFGFIPRVPAMMRLRHLRHCVIEPFTPSWSMRSI